MSVGVFYTLIKPDRSAEDELDHVQGEERGITQEKKNAAPFRDSERKRCPTAALDSLSQTLYENPPLPVPH